MTFALYGKSMLVSSWSTKVDAPIFLAIYAYLSMSSRSSWCIYLLSSSAMSTSMALRDSVCSFWLGPTSSINSPFAICRTSFSCQRLHTSLVSFFIMSFIFVSLALMFLDDSSCPHVVWECVVADISMACYFKDSTNNVTVDIVFL